MHSIRVTFALGAALLFLVPRVAAACSCGRVVAENDPAPVRRPPVERSVVFVGNALEVDDPDSTTHERLVRFLPEASWRGAMPDSITLIVADAPCATFRAGMRYLVAAERDAADTTRLRTSLCDYEIGLGYPRARALLDALGAPGWRAPPIGQRSIGEAAVPLGSPLSRVPTGGAVLFIISIADSVRSFEIGDVHASSAQPSRRLVYLQPARYVFRITWNDGTVYESVLSARCESLPGEGQCQVFRGFLNLRGAP